MGRYYLAGVVTGAGLVIGALVWLGYTAAEEDRNRPIRDYPEEIPVEGEPIVRT